MMVPFIDLKLQYKIYQKELESAILETCASTEYILGPEVTQFENNFATFLGVKFAVGVASGTDALRISCLALGIGIDDEVLIPANTFIATALAVREAGASPVPVDVCPDTLLMDLGNAKKQISNRTKAIIPVHLYGQAMDMDSMTTFAKKNGLSIIEDACQAHGAMWKKKRLGSFGDFGCFSFYPSKNLGAFGDAGIVTTNDSKLADKLKMLRNYGSRQKNIHEIPGTNSRLDSMQAAVLNVKLKYLDEWNGKRFEAACRYAEGLRGIKGVKIPAFDQSDPRKHVFHLFVIQSDRRNELLRHLKSNHIQSGIHYPFPIHLHKVFASLKFANESYPVAEKSAKRILSLPMFPEITSQQIDTVLKAIKSF